MIRSLRRRHLIFSFIMVVGLPVMVVSAYLKTRGENQMEVLPKLEPETFQSYLLEVWHKPRLWKDLPSMDTRLLTNTQPEHGLAVELTFPDTIADPDLLLYWSPRAFSVRSGIGDNMYFLGSFSSNETTLFELPDVARNRDGFLLLYSLANDEVISEAPIVNPLK